MRLLTMLTVILVSFAGCTSEGINSNGITKVNQLDFLPDCVENDNQTVLMNIFQGQALEESLAKYSICIRLNFNASPIHSENFITHVTYGNYNSTNFHRIIDDFMIQGGDFENNDGSGGYASNWYGYCNGQASGDSNCSGYGQNAWTIPDEANNGLKHLPCTISMAKTQQSNTGASQFFIIPEDSTPSHLDGVHTVFGEIIEGCEHIKTISEVITDSRNSPLTPIIIHNATLSN